MTVDPVFQNALDHIMVVNSATANEAFIEHIQDALGTAETGAALIDVARNAHRAEMRVVRLEANLLECREYLDNYIEVTDGSCGGAMSLVSMIDETVNGSER